MYLWYVSLFFADRLQGSAPCRRFLSRRTPVRARRSKALLGISGSARAGGPRTAASRPSGSDFQGGCRRRGHRGVVDGSIKR